jgi:single-strand DNA-binding protein
MNNVSLIARLGKNPDLNQTKGGMSICTLRVAFEQGKDKDAGWIDVVCMEKIAEAVTQYCHKGDEVGISGRLSYRTWEGDGHQRSVLEIVAQRVDFLRRKGEGNGSQEREQEQEQSQPAAHTPTKGANPFDD